MTKISQNLITAIECIYSQDDNSNFIIGPLTTTYWHQENPYNAKLPDPGWLIGCTAIAMGQLIRYHRYPDIACGVIPAYKDFPGLDINGHEYKWDLMPDSITVNSSIDEIEQTSTFLYHVGLMAETHFNYGSPGSIKCVINQMQEQYNYDKDIQRIDMSVDSLYYTYPEFISMLKEELELKRPFYFSPQGLVHAVICDGYNENDEFSFNFGGGMSQYVKEISYKGYLPEGDTVIGLRPHEPEKLEASYISAPKHTIYPGDDGEVFIYIQNITSEMVNGEVRLIFSDNADVKRGNLTDYTKIQIAPNVREKIVFKFHVDQSISFGERRIQIEYKDEDVKRKRIRATSGDCIASSDLICTKRSISEKIYWSLYDGLIDIHENDQIELTLELTGYIEEATIISVLLVDELYNHEYVVGTVHIAGFNNKKTVVVLCDFTNVAPEKTYNAIIVQSCDKQEEWSNAKLITGNDGHTTLKRIYVDHKRVIYGDDKIIISTSPNENITRYTKSTYNMKYDIIVDEDVSQEEDPWSGLTKFIINIKDSSGKIIEHGEDMFFFDKPGIYSADKNIMMPLVEDDEVFELSIQYLRYPFEGEWFYMKSENNNNKNPSKILVTYRNNYDGFYLTKSLTSSENKLYPGDAFDLNSCIIYQILDPAAPTLGFELKVYMKDCNGHVFVIGELDRTPLICGQEKELIVHCEIPLNIPSMDYNVYVQVFNMSNETGAPPDKVQGISPDLQNEISITVL